MVGGDGQDAGEALFGIGPAFQRAQDGGAVKHAIGIVGKGGQQGLGLVQALGHGQALGALQGLGRGLGLGGLGGGGLAVFRLGGRAAHDVSWEKGGGHGSKSPTPMGMTFPDIVGMGPMGHINSCTPGGRPEH